MITICHNCICNVCTKYHCPYNNGSRCRLCLSYEFNKIYDCDFFESQFTAPRRYKIHRISKPTQDKLNQKLDFIIESLNLIIPKFQPADLGTYEILYKGMIIFTGNKKSTNDFIAKYQDKFYERLVVRKAKFDSGNTS